MIDPSALTNSVKFAFRNRVTVNTGTRQAQRGAAKLSTRSAPLRQTHVSAARCRATASFWSRQPRSIIGLRLSSALFDIVGFFTASVPASTYVTGSMISCASSRDAVLFVKSNSIPYLCLYDWREGCLGQFGLPDHWSRQQQNERSAECEQSPVWRWCQCPHHQRGDHQHHPCTLRYVRYA